jgi:uncharacterized phage protein (TIGR01671 family)
MDREIKFRAYNPEEKKMSVDFTLYEIATAGSKTIFPFGVTANKNTILMQYTGLKDKNGVEIYEGDVILGDQVVEWVDENNARFDQEVGCYGIQNGKHNLVSYRKRDNYEVIGNIYENLNLIKEEE